MAFTLNVSPVAVNSVYSKLVRRHPHYTLILVGLTTSVPSTGFLPPA